VRRCAAGARWPLLARFCCAPARSLGGSPVRSLGGAPVQSLGGALVRGLVGAPGPVLAGAIAAVMVMALSAPPALAYKRSINSGGVCIYWATRGHTFYIDSRGTPDVAGPAAFDAIRHSFAAWSGPTCSDLFFQDLGLSNDRRVGYFPGEFNRNLVLFRTANCHNSVEVVPPGDPCIAAGSCGNQYDCWNHDDSVIATTTTTSNRYTGQINDTDIELNDSPASDGTRFRFSTADSPACSATAQTDCVSIDIQNTVTHEAGHSIGLDHSLDPVATMYATAPLGETSKRKLHQDDTDAVCAIYPKGLPTATCLGSPLTLTAGAASDGGGLGCSLHSRSNALDAGALGLSLLALRRRARKRA